MEENGSIDGGIRTRFLHSSLFRLRRSLPLLVLALLGSFALIQLAHASTYVGYGSTNLGGNTCGTNCLNPGDANHGIGQTIQAPFTGQLTGAGFFVGSVAPTQIVIGTFAPGVTPTSSTASCGGAGTDSGINGGQSFSVQDVESLSGVVGQSFNTVNLANPVSVTQNQYVTITFMISSNFGPGMLMLLGTGASTSFFDTIVNFGTSSPTVGNSYSTSNGAGQCGPIVGGSFTPVGQSGTTVTVTQCYGNCGSPPITLVNTNSTHAINFNQSVTLLYEFQSNLNGFVINVTTNVGRNYNNGIGIIQAIYTIPSCPTGATPFSSTCPGFIASGWNVVGNPGKGRSTNGNYLIPVSNGQWVGITITATMSGLDLNDTNTGIALFQTNGGGCACPPPPTISSATLRDAGSKIGLWAFIRGNVITSAPPASTPGVCESFAGIDCLFPAIVNGFCTNFTQSCQTSSALFWVVMLSIFVMFILQFGVSRLLPNSKFIAGGEIFILLFISFILMFSGLGLLPIWIPVLIFFLVSLFMGKSVGKYV